jgi:hypothetical protein
MNHVEYDKSADQRVKMADLVRSHGTGRPCVGTARGHGTGRPCVGTARGVNQSVTDPAPAPGSRKH